jgi:hypothetical protein
VGKNKKITTARTIVKTKRGRTAEETITPRSKRIRMDNRDIRHRTDRATIATRKITLGSGHTPKEIRKTKNESKKSRMVLARTDGTKTKNTTTAITRTGEKR